MLKLVTVVGARPQFIKAAAVSRCIRAAFATQVEEILVHTGQHYDDNMSSVFFAELDIPEPRYNLGVGGGSHGEMTGEMLAGVERILVQEQPDWLVIYGDTNSTLAGALAAAKLHIPVAHVEAGLRSFNMLMPEEINRVVADRVSTLLFAPTQVAVDNLAREGQTEGVFNVGDVMYDVSLYSAERAARESTIIERLGLPDQYALATCHRAENTDDPVRLRNILSALEQVATRFPVVLPVHPRTKGKITEFGLDTHTDGLVLADPLPFLDMVALERSAQLILTDSGGVQKEAFFYGVPCVTMRDETEWVETVNSGWNVVVGADRTAILEAVEDSGRRAKESVKPYGDGRASYQIIERLIETTRRGAKKE